MENPIYTLQEINKRYPNWYNPKSDLSYDDQLFIWQNTTLPTNDNVYEIGNDNGGCKSLINSEQIWCKSDLVLQLKYFDSFTPPKLTDAVLKKLFANWPSYDGHWLWISQTYTPRVINWVLALVIKDWERGAIRKNPAQYFTFLIKKRKKRMEFRNENNESEAKK